MLCHLVSSHTPYVNRVKPRTSSHILPASHQAAPFSSGPCLHHIKPPTYSHTFPAPCHATWYLHLPYMHHVIPPTSSHILPVWHPLSSGPCLHRIKPPTYSHTFPAPFHATWYLHLPYMHHVIPPTSSHILPAWHPLSSGPCLHSPAHCSVHIAHHWQTRFLRTARKSRLCSRWTGTGNLQSLSWTLVAPKIQHTFNLTVTFQPLHFTVPTQNIWSAMSV